MSWCALSVEPIVSPSLPIPSFVFDAYFNQSNRSTLSRREKPSTQKFPINSSILFEKLFSKSSEGYSYYNYHSLSFSLARATSFYIIIRRHYAKRRTFYLVFVQWINGRNILVLFSAFYIVHVPVFFFLPFYTRMLAFRLVVGSFFHPWRCLEGLASSGK